MCNVSSQFKSVYGTQEAIIKKGIATEKEMEKISKKDDTSMAWLDKWWVPLNWCCHRIRVELEADGHLSGYVKYEFGLAWHCQKNPIIHLLIFAYISTSSYSYLCFFNFQCCRI